MNFIQPLHASLCVYDVIENILFFIICKLLASNYYVYVGGSSV
jgi:hypothetical protein